MTGDHREPDVIPRPHKASDYLLVFQGASVHKQWQDCLTAARNAATDAWDALTVAPAQVSERQYQLRGELAFRTYRGHALPQWEHKISNGGRLIYLIDDQGLLNARGRQTHAGTVIMLEASPGHPKRTEKVLGARKSPGRR